MKSSGVSVQCGKAEAAGNQNTHLKVPQQNAICSQSLWAIVEGGQWGLEWPKETMGFQSLGREVGETASRIPILNCPLTP